MANFAPPICRDGFVYHGQLFADVGNLNRHPRASIQDLNDLLRPSKRPKDGQPKDQVGHWYFAQLKHYGLPTTKDKNAAKVRLLDALNGGKLTVPNQLKKLESQLKKEYDAANKKAKAEMKTGETTSASQVKATPNSNKRKREDDEIVAKKAPAKKKATSTPTPATSTINVGQNGGININIAYQEFLGNVGDAGKKSTPKKAATKKSQATAQSTTAPKGTTSKGTASKSATSTTTTQKKTAAKSTTAARKTSTGASGSVKKSAAKGTAAASKKTATPKDKPMSPAKTKAVNKKDAASGPKPTHTNRRTSGVIKQEDDYFNSSGATTPFDSGIARHYGHNPDLVKITGIYDIRSNIEEDFPALCENGCRMMLCHEISTGRVWGCFSFAIYFGIIQLNPGPAYFSPHSLSLGWRAKNLERNTLRFGRGCTGNMVFECPGEISGKIFGLHDYVVEFYGTRRDGPFNCGYAPSQFEEEWTSYVDIGYGRPAGGELYDEDGEPYDEDGDLYDEDGELYDDDGGLSDEDGELYDEDGTLRPTGKYEELMRETLGAW